MSPRTENPLDIARAHWGPDMPEWVQALADACTETSQNKVAARLNRSAALVSTVLRNRYAGNMETVEQLVRGVFLAETADCPALGTLPMHECTAWRVKARAFANTNALRVRMYRACRTCPRFKATAAVIPPRHPATSIGE